MRRVPSQELLDEDLGSPEEIRQSFDDLWRINRYLGGVSGCLHLLDQFFARTGPHPVRILEVGSGDGRLAARLRDELMQRGVRAEFVTLDCRLSHLRYGDGSAAGVSPVVADVFKIPFSHDRFDLVICNLFFHHFSGERATELLQRLFEVASKAVLINDLERHPLPYFFIHFALPFARSRITRHDGPASVRQAYTRDELQKMAEQAGFRHFDVERLPAYRLGLTLWKQ